MSLFKTYEQVCKGLLEVQTVLESQVDYTDGDAVAEKLAELNQWYSYSCTLMASAELWYRKDKKSEEKFATNLLAERLNNSLSLRIRTYISLLSSLKEDKRIHFQGK